MNLFLKIKKESLPFFISLVERGFYVTIPSGMTIYECLTRHFNLSDAYVENRIQTIFLNHKPVDDVCTARLSANDRLAISAAMPGLLGATMRKKGAYAAMRDSISYQAEGDENEGSGKEVHIFVKFFNLIAKEIGPDVLKKGIILTDKQFQNDLIPILERIRENLLIIQKEDKPSSIEDVLILPDQEIFIKVGSE